MSAVSKQRYIEQQALRAAQRAIDRRGREHFDPTAFRSTRIQTMEPWARILLVALSAVAGICGYFALTPSVGMLSITLFGVSALLLAAAAFGVRKTVAAALDGVDPIQIIAALF